MCELGSRQIECMQTEICPGVQDGFCARSVTEKLPSCTQFPRTSILTGIQANRPAPFGTYGQFLRFWAPWLGTFFYGQNFSCRLPPRPICSTKLLHFDSVASNLPAGGRAHGCYRHPSAPVALNLATGLSVRLCSGSETSILTTIIGMTLGVPPLAKISAAGLPPRPKRIDSCPAPFGTYGTRPAIYNFVRLQCDLPSGP